MRRKSKSWVAVLTGLLVVLAIGAAPVGSLMAQGTGRTSQPSGKKPQVPPRIEGMELLQELQTPDAVITPIRNIGLLVNPKLDSASVRLGGSNAFVMEGGAVKTIGTNKCGAVRLFSYEQSVPEEEQSTTLKGGFGSKVIHVKQLVPKGNYALRVTYFGNEPDVKVVLDTDVEPPERVVCASAVSTDVSIGGIGHAVPGEKHGEAFHYQKGDLKNEEGVFRLEDVVETSEVTLYRREPLKGFFVYVINFGPNARFYFQPGVIPAPPDAWIPLPHMGISEEEVKGKRIEVLLGGIVAGDTERTPLGQYGFRLDAFEIPAP